MQQNLKVIIVLGVSVLVQGSSEWLLWSYVVEILCLNKDETGFVNKDLIIDRMPSTILQQNLKVVIVLGVTMLVLGFCGWLLWSYLVEILWLDTNKTGFVDVDPPLDILVFFERPRINTWSRVSK